MSFKIVRKKISVEEIAEVNNVCLEVIGVFEKYYPENGDYPLAAYALKKIVNAFEKLSGIPLDTVVIKEGEVVKGAAG